MNQLNFILMLCFGTVFSQIQAQDFLSFTALESEGYGAYAHNPAAGHSIPKAVCGVLKAYYNLVSAEQSGNQGTKGALHLVSGGTGFSGFNNALTANGYTIDQVEMTFSEMSLGPDVHLQDWYCSNDTEVRFYRGGTFNFTLDGHDLVDGNMPTMMITIDYNTFSNCGDDNILGLSQYFTVSDASGSSPAGVQNVAAALIADIGNLGVRFDFSGMQPAAQGNDGAIFEAQTGKIELGTEYDVGLQNTNVAPMSANTCVTANTNVNSTGSGDWLHILHNNERVCSIFDSEAMGIIDATIYINTGSVRETGTGTEYLDRNFEINPTTQPTNPVRVRLYYSSEEWGDFLDANDSDGNDIMALSELKITKFDTTCLSAVAGGGGTLLSVLEWGTADDGEGYYFDVEVTGFSAFFIHGGSEAVFPVELTDFNVRAIKGKALLNWQTASETQNRGWEIEHGTDARNWQNIGFISGVSESSETQFYSFIHKQPSSGINYYRLKQLDFDGDFEYSNVVSVEFSVVGFRLSVVPNPTQNGTFTLYIPENNAESIQMEIFDLTGRLVRRSLITEIQTEINVANLEKGVYLVKAEAGRIVNWARVVIQ